jgi:CMP-N-acetylneuraminic acid synthetase
MFKGKRVLGIIPARGGSRRLPGKNIAHLNGKPLIAWTIEAGRMSNILDKLIVSTEDADIGELAIKWGADKTVRRSIHLASDNASINNVVLEALSLLKDDGEEFGYIVLLQPTSPLRTENHIRKAFRLIEERGGVGVISVSRTEHPIEWMGNLSPDGFLDSFIRETSLDKQSQEFVPSYQINGAIYIVPVDRFLEENTFFLATGMVAYVMDRMVSVDIDDEYDLRLAEWLLKEGAK